ncbi:histamine N-methyltransferase B-like [Hydractinia symbiolongicarpus]|uniref:histamine N-methyltransferase B-like n=1 Tax=Hydractinia symbiolongicarpus TaxID=13093 RepID=UPI00254BDB74|nr:histamine N-methyltransferase B-like [Hydractinia symbiolongicarpus]
MADEQQNTLLSDDTNYRLTLQTYLKYMQQLPPQREWMNTKLAPRLSEIFQSKNVLKVLAVGTGSGEVDIDFLDVIVKVGKEKHGEDYSVVYQVVEPNPSNVKFFRDAVTDKESYSKVKFNWFQGFYEDFLEEFKKTESEENKFDFAHFVRCFYHIDSVKGLDTTYQHFLAKNGIVAVVGENEDAFWPKNMLFLNDHGMKHECFTCSGPVSQAYFLPGWISQATEKGWKHETYTHRYNFDVTPMFDETSNIGNYLIDFATHAKQARKTVKKEILDDFFAFLNKNIVETKIEEDGKEVNKKYFPCQLGAIIITRE